jgi:ATP-binding cassette, subfamily C, bacterial
VPQETFIFHDSIRENVTLGDRTLSDEEVYRALELAGARELMREIEGGLDANLGERGSRLSGGERQRIGIARALVRQPTLLILDEVTSALDPTTEAGICDTIRRLPEDATILAVSHRPAFVEAAQRVVRLENGTFTELATLVDHRGVSLAQTR